MLQNQNLTEFAQYWGDIIVGNSALQTYCQTKFAKSATVVIAPPEHYLPGAEDAPFIFLHSPSKQEGASKTKCLYSLIVSVGIVTDDPDITTTAGTKVMAGQKYLSDMLKLVQEALNADCRPPATIEQDIPVLDGANPTFWAGFLSATWEIEIPLGRTNYFE